MLQWVGHDNLETRTHLGTHDLFAILIGQIGAVGLLLAGLHGIEATLILEPGWRVMGGW